MYDYSVNPATLNCDGRYVPNFDLMPHSSPVFTGIVRSSYGTHLLDHLATDRTGLAAGQITVVTVLQVNANLSGGHATILKVLTYAGKFKGISGFSPMNL